MTTKDITSFENILWRASCILQGILDPTESKTIIFGLLFLKLFSDRTTIKEPKATWDYIVSYTHSDSLGSIINAAMDTLEKENLFLENTLPKNYDRPELKYSLGKIVDAFSDIDTATYSTSFDLLSHTYEYYMSRLSGSRTIGNNEYFTLSSIAKIMLNILLPDKGSIYDPCSGTGSLFFQLIEHLKVRNEDLSNITLFGQESNPSSWKIAKMNLALQGVSADLGGYAADTFCSDQHPSLHADYILANPPFNQFLEKHTLHSDDIRWQYGIPREGNANYAWLQHMIFHLSPTGKMAAVMANGSLTSNIRGDNQIRKNIVCADLVDCIISLPPRLFYNTSTPCCLWVISRNKAHHGQTLFVDARTLGTMTNNKLREFSENDIQLISTTYQSYCAGSLTCQNGFSYVATLEEIAKKNYTLTPGQYIDLPALNDRNNEMDSELERLSCELSELFIQSDELRRDLCQKLASIGITIQ